MLPYWWDGVLVDARYMMLEGGRLGDTWLARGGKEMYLVNKEQSVQVGGRGGGWRDAEDGEWKEGGGEVEGCEGKGKVSGAGGGGEWKGCWGGDWKEERGSGGWGGGVEGAGVGGGG